MSNENKKHHKHESLEELDKADERALEADEPTVIESSASDPEFPADSEYEVDEGGFKGSTKKHPGIIWAIIAIVAVVVLCIAFAAIGDWFTPDQAERNAQLQFEEETVPEDLGAN